MDTSILEAEDPRCCNRSDDHHESRRQPRHKSFEHDQRTKTDQADDDGGTVGIADVTAEVDHLGDEPFALGFDTEHLAELPADDGDRHASDKPLEHRLGEELRQDPELGDRRQSEDHTHDDRQGHRQRDEALGVGGERCDGRGRNGGGRGARPDRHAPRGTDERVDDQRHGRDVQPDFGGHTGNAGIGDALGDDDRPHRHRGCDVARQPCTLVRAQVTEELPHQS